MTTTDTALAIPDADTAKDIKAAFVNAGFRVEIYSGMPGYLVRVLGERQNYQEAERLARQHRAKWVSEAQAYEHIAALGYPNTAA